MDTSETYIKMRIAAIPDLGRGKPLEGTFRSDNYYVFENDIYSVFISPSGDWYTFHPSIEMSQQGRTCQLERQDQLQEMCWELTGTKWTPFFALTMVRNFADALQLGEPDYVTLEQLWLAFVMKEKYNKVWNGEKWIKT